MDSAKQAIRWGIPGWLFFLFLFISHFFYLYLFNLIIADSESFDVSSIFSSYSIYFPSVLVIVGVLGIPIGYVIYQFYFLISRSLVKEVSDLLYNIEVADTDILDRADTISKEWIKKEEENNEALTKLGNEGILPYFFKNSFHWLYRRMLNIFFLRRTKTISERLKDIDLLEIKWASIDVLLRKKILDKKLCNGYDEIIRRDNHLSDMIHSLGATSYSAMIAYIFYFINLTRNLYFNLHFHEDAELRFMLTFIACYSIPFIITIIFTFVTKSNARKATLHKITFLRELINSK